MAGDSLVIDMARLPADTINVINRANWACIYNTVILAGDDPSAVGRVNAEVLDALRRLSSAEITKIANCGHPLVGPRMPARRLRRFEPSGSPTQLTKSVNGAFMSMAASLLPTWAGRFMMGLDDEDADAWATISESDRRRILAHSVELVCSFRLRSAAHVESLLSGSRNAIAYSLLATRSFKTWEHNPL